MDVGFGMSCGVVIVCVNLVLCPLSMVQALDRCVVALQLSSPALTSLLSEGVGGERGKGGVREG